MIPNRQDIHEKLYYYVDKRDLETVKKLLDEGANATKETTFGRTAVGQAAFKGFSEILQILLKSCEEEFAGTITKKFKTESDVEQTPDGMDGLLWDDEIYQQSSSTFLPDDEWSRLYKYYARIIEKTGDILANSVKLKDPHCLDSYNQAPIHYAAFFGHIDCVKILLQNGSPVDLITTKGVTPMHLAVQDNDILLVLIKHKGDPNRKTYNTGETPLHTAAQIGSVLSIETLLECGADINATNNRDRTPLMVAILSGRTENAHYLIDKGAKINIQDSKGRTALYFAVSTRNYTTTLLLLAYDARLFATHNLLHLCVRENSANIARLLLDAGENIFKRDMYGRTPLLSAIKLCKEQMIEFFLQNGGQEIEYEDNMKELHFAVQYIENIEKFSKVVRILLSYGFSMNDCNDWKETPVKLAAFYKKYNYAEFLIQEGANVNEKGNQIFLNNLLLNRQISFKLRTILVNSGLLLSPVPSNLKPPPWNNIATDIDDWLAFTYKTPRSLKTLCRIMIRNCLIKNLQTTLAETKDYNESRLMQLIRQTELPISLQEYIYELSLS